MINPFAEVNWNPDNAQRRQFAKSLLIGFPALAVAFFIIGWIRHGRWDASLEFCLWLAGLGAGAGALFWFLPQISRPFYVIWYFLACCIGFVMANLLMAIFYYVVVTGIGLTLRLLRKLTFSKGFNKTATSYWKDAPPPPPPSRYYKQF